MTVKATDEDQNTTEFTFNITIVNEYESPVGEDKCLSCGWEPLPPTFTLKKMLLSGSIAKGTALRSLNDIDLACYISGADTPHDVAELLDYLTERLRKAFPNFSPEQVAPQTYSVTVSFRGTGLDVDVVPILYDGDPQWYGGSSAKTMGPTWRPASRFTSNS